MLAQQKMASRRVVRICRQLISSPTLGEESLADLPIKELKKRLKDRGIRHNDCLTKTNLVNRLREWLPHAVTATKIDEVRQSAAADEPDDDEASLLEQIKAHDYTTRKEAERACLRLWANECGKEASNVLAFADSLISEDKNYGKAKELLLPLAEAHPNWAEPKVRLGIVLVEEGDAVAAIDLLETALEQRDNHFKALRVLGKAQLSVADLDACRETMAALLELQPSIAEQFLAILDQVGEFLEQLDTEAGEQGFDMDQFLRGVGGGGGEEDEID